MLCKYILAQGPRLQTALTPVLDATPINQTAKPGSWQHSAHSTTRNVSINEVPGAYMAAGVGR